MIQLQSYYKRVWKESMSGLGKIFDSSFRTRQRRATRYTSADSSTKALKELVQPRPTCCHQSILLQPSESLQDRIQWNAWCSLRNYCCRKPTRKGAQRLLGPCPHLPPLPLQPPHPLLSPLGPHCSKSPLEIARLWPKDQRWEVFLVLRSTKHGSCTGYTV